MTRCELALNMRSLGLCQALMAGLSAVGLLTIDVRTVYADASVRQCVHDRPVTLIRGTITIPLSQIPAFDLQPMIVVVSVVVSGSGVAKQATIVQSSHDQEMDDAARAAALHAKYRPRYLHCRPVEGTYYYRVQFTDDDT